MNNSFIEFLDEDIKSKKELITSLPVRLKKDKYIFNDRLDELSNTYLKYKDIILKHLEKKYNKKMTNLHVVDNSEEIKNIQIQINKTKSYIDYHNPINTYFEKLNMHKYFYVLYHYSDYTFLELNIAIDKLITILESANVKITEKNFYYNYYVNKYMKQFLEFRKTSKEFTKLQPFFEECYWVDSMIIKNIYLNFRSIIDKYKKQLTTYSEKIILKYTKESHFDSFDSNLKKLKELYDELEHKNEETISLIIQKAINKEIDINNYLENSKAKNDIFENIQIVKIDNNDNKALERLYNNLNKLHNDLIQYKSYYEVSKFIDLYKEDYTEEESLKDNSKELKSIYSEIVSKEKKLKKYYKKLGVTYYGKSAREEILKKLKSEPLDINKEMEELYDKFDHNFITNRMLSFYEDPITVEDLLTLFYSFKQYQMNILRRIANQPIPYDIIKSKQKEFDRYVLNPTHDLINTIPVFKEYDIKNIIVTKYRLNNLNISNDELDFDTIGDLISRVELLLRDKRIKESDITAQDISIIVRMHNVLKKENLIEEA